MILAMGWISYAQPGARLGLAVLLFGLAFVFAKNVTRDQAITMILAIAVVVATIDYLAGAIIVTNWYGWWVSVPLLFAETLRGYSMCLVFNLPSGPGRRRRLRMVKIRHSTRNFIFIPTVNEGVAILRPRWRGDYRPR